MGYCDFSDAELRALTRLRRREAAERRLAEIAARPIRRFSVLYQLAEPADPDPLDGEEDAHAIALHLVRRRSRRSRRSKVMQGFKLRAWESGVRNCCYCAVAMTLRLTLPETATCEHRLPRSRGGADEDRNFALSCSRCNNAKGNMTEGEFLEARGGTSFPIPWS
jgi:5-methylcytosine-specific restriction endonuclease McrA